MDGRVHVNEVTPYATLQEIGKTGWKFTRIVSIKGLSMRRKRLRAAWSMEYIESLIFG